MGGELDFTGKTVLVTGGSRGIGRAASIFFAERGAAVAINFSSNEAAAKEARERVVSAGARCEIYRADVADLGSVQEMVKQIVKDFGRIDILVNSAGITRDKPLLMMSEGDWDAVLNVNLKGVYNCTKVALKPMVKNKWGRVISITSPSAILGRRGQTNYAASKGGIISFTKSLAKEVARFNITVNAVSPGVIETDMTGAMPDKAREELLAAIPMERFGRPEDIAWAIGFLASPRSGYITGQVLPVDGGLT